MSTKTTFKRIALVAVAALGFGMVSTVSASAADIAGAWSITDTTSAASTVAAAGITPGAAGTPISVNLLLSSTASTGAGTLVTTFVLTDPNGTAVTSAATFTSVAAPVANLTGTNAANVSTLTYAATMDATATLIGTMTFTPTMGGVYALTSTSVITSTATADTNTPNELAGASADGAIYVSGAGAKVASSGIGTSTVGAVVGGNAIIRFATGLHTTGSTYNLTSAGVGTIQTVGDGTLAPASSAGIAGATDFTQGAKVVTDADATMNDVLATVASTVAGVQTLTWSGISATTGAPTTVAVVTITWGGVGAVSTTYTTAFITAGQTFSTVDDDPGVLLPMAATTAVGANIAVSLKDAVGSPLLGQKLTVTIAGPGNIVVTGQALGTITTTAGARAVTTVANALSTFQIGVSADGTAGTSTVSVFVGTTLVATKTLAFYGAAKTITATQNYSIAKASSTGGQLGVSTSNTTATTGYVPAVSLLIEDAAANGVAATITCVPTDTLVISGCVIVADDDATYGGGVGYYNASVVSAPNGVSGASSTVVFRTLLSTGTYVTSAPVTFTLGGAIVTTSVTTDKTSYSPGEAMVLTVTAKDSAGNPSYDGQAILGSISVNKAIGGALPAVTKVFAKGKYATSATAPTLFAPAVDGSLTIAGVSRATTAAPTGVPYSVTVAVENGVTTAAAQAAADAASEATDAANAATDAANAAAEAADAATAAAQDASDAVAALSTRVSTMITALKKQLIALTNLVIKIQKKVKA